MATKNPPKNPHKFSCLICDYFTSSLKDCNKHLNTKKHKQHTEATIATVKILNCEQCNKKFMSRSGLWRHKRQCLTENIISIGENVSILKNEDNRDADDKNEEQDIDLDENGNINIDNLIVDGKIKNKDALVIHLLKQNSELQKSLIEMSKEKSIINNTDCYNTNNTHNSFNLNFFLNETCKHAMNITDFVSSIKVSIDDLENTGRIGYVEGISDIIIKNLNKLEQWFRPIHCSDFKREVLYIKNNDKWEKETEEKPILTKAIKVIANENIKQINNWKDKYPGCTNAESRKNDMYLKIVGNAMNGSTKEEGAKNINKIISNVAKGVIIKK
jgi:hypothetical protein